jgi:hypothetical protein
MNVREHPPQLIQEYSDLRDSIIEADKSNFDVWIAEAMPFQQLPHTHEVLRYFIPPMLLKHMPNPAGVDIASKIVNNFVEIQIVEELDMPITNIDSLLSYHKAVHKYSLSPQNIPYPVLPDDVDVMHWEFLDSVLSQTINENEKILLNIALDQLGPELHVANYSDREEWRGVGIATSFYERLREIAKKLGFQYITGDNNRKNISFFTNKLGRKRYEQLPPDLQKMFRSNHGDIDTFDDFTVDILDP